MLMVYLFYLVDVQRQPICFHCYWLLSTAPVKFTQYLANKKEKTLVLQEMNSSYLGGRDQEDHGLKLAQANSSWDPISKNPTQK
jgi:hypothetical protein